MQKFTGCKIFVATLNRHRPALGDEATAWLTEMRQHPGFKVTGMEVRQSSGEAYHCLSLVVFFHDNAKSPAPTTSK